MWVDPEGISHITAPEVEKMRFENIQCSLQCPYSASEKKVQENKKTEVLMIYTWSLPIFSPQDQNLAH